MLYNHRHLMNAECKIPLKKARPSITQHSLLHSCMLQTIGVALNKHQLSHCLALATAH